MHSTQWIILTRILTELDVSTGSNYINFRTKTFRLKIRILYLSFQVLQAPVFLCAKFDCNSNTKNVNIMKYHLSYNSNVLELYIRVYTYIPGQISRKYLLTIITINVNMLFAFVPLKFVNQYSRSS